MDYDKMSDAELAAELEKKNNAVDYDKMSDSELASALANKNAKKLDTSGPNPMAMFQGYGQGLSSGHLPQLQALADYPINKIGNLVTGSNVELDPYSKRRDEAARTILDLQKNNPGSFGFGQLGGSLNQGMLLPGSKLLEGAKLPAKIAAGAGTMAALSMAQNPGDTPGEVNPIQLGERLSSLKNPGMIADFPGGSMVEGAATPLIGPLSDRLKMGANRAAVSAMGPYKRAIAILKSKGEGAIDSMGSDILDKGVIGWIPRFHGTLADRAREAASKSGEGIDQYLGELSMSAKRAEDKMASELSKTPEGRAKLSTTQQLSEPSTAIDPSQVGFTDKPLVGMPPRDVAISNKSLVPYPKGMNPFEFEQNLERDVGSSPVGEKVMSNGPEYQSQNTETKFPIKVGLDRQKIADQMRRDLIEAHTDIPGVTRDNYKISKLISEFEDGGDGVIPLINAELKKRATGKQITWNRLPGTDVPIAEKVNRNLYSKLRSGVEDAGDYLEKNAGGPSVGKFQKLKKEYGNLSTAADIAENKDTSEQARNLMRMTTTAATLGGLGYGLRNAMNPEHEFQIEDLYPAAIMGLGTAGLNKFGFQVGAKTMNAASKAGNLATKNPWLLNEAIKKTGEQ